MFRRCACLFSFAASLCLGAQSGSLIVTAEAKDQLQQAAPGRDDISVELDRKAARVVSWTPLKGDAAALQLYIVIDDADGASLGAQFSDLKNFISSQPATTQIGIVYLQYGSAHIAQALTSDHARAANALRLPLGQPGMDASPYDAIQDLMKKWPAADSRREMLAVMSGIDPLYTSPDMQDPYLANTISAAQKAGIVISSIYYPDAGHFGHSFYRSNWGQNYLSMLDDETGGEFYWQGWGTPVSLSPYLNQFGDWLNRQYLLEVESADGGKPGLESISVKSRQPGVSLVHASRVWLGSDNRPAAQH